MTAILGISAFYHDSAAALLVDGEIVAAAGRRGLLVRKMMPHFQSMPLNTVSARRVCQRAKLCVGFYEKPLLKFDRLKPTSVMLLMVFFFRAMRVGGSKAAAEKRINKGLGGEYLAESVL